MADYPIKARRTCGDCSLCCKLPYVRVLNKSIDTWCPHVRPGRGGCTIYANRPAACRNFACGWLERPDLIGEEWFPAKCKMVLSDHEAVGVLVTVDPAFPNAWRREPYYSQILAWARQVQAHGLILQIRIGRRFIVPRPDGSEQEVIRTQASIEGRDEPPTSEQDGISKQGEQ
jgi:hypothetical protein